MTPHIRKLLSLPDDHHPIDYPITNTDTETSTSSSSSSSSSSTPLLSKFEEREYQNLTTNFTGNNNSKLSPPFDSAMALTVLVLLTALFFMGFFSIYIRRFADESSVDPTRRSRSRSSGSGSGSSDLSSTTSSSLARSKKGVDPTMIESLPVHAYGGGGEKQGIEMELECAICLSEFEEREWVKEIPYCGHVFHVECIDTWLSSHVTCPLCRTAKLFPAVEEREKEVVVAVVHVAVGEEEGERGLGVSEMQGDLESGGEREGRLVVDERDTWDREVGPIGERRSTSCSSWFGERLTLHRSFSF